MYRGGLSLFAGTALMIFGRGENRARVLKLIESQPGLTLYDLKRHLNLNLGTARYHLLVLALNHRISPYNDGTKYVRYFKNSNTFSDDEKAIISLLRRTHVREILNAVLSRPGIRNADVATLIGIPESAVSRCMRMLAIRGIVVKTSPNGEKATYKIVDSNRQLIFSCLKIVEGQKEPDANSNPASEELTGKLEIFSLEQYS